MSIKSANTILIVTFAILTKGIGYLWQEISQLSGKREKKSRIVHVEGTGSGYGKATVPVLASNNYELENGESSVFDRELSHNKRAAFGTGKKKARKFENQDHCQVRHLIIMIIEFLHMRLQTMYSDVVLC